MKKWIVTALAIVTASAQTLPNLAPFPNASGAAATFNINNAPISLTGAFFQSLGTNGRSCESCHRAAQGWAISSDEVRSRFDATNGLDPIFRTNDGSNCDHNIDTTSLGGRRQAYSLLISRGLIRVALAPPANAEFTVANVQNQYGCNETTTLSMYRRPLPSTNLRFLSTVMWDGRESTTATGTMPITFATNPSDLIQDLRHQAVDATTGHAQGTGLTQAQIDSIVNFEMSLMTAQISDRVAGPLSGNGATGGPVRLGALAQSFFVGINDPLGQNPNNIAFTPLIFDLFNAWAGLAPPPGPGGPGGPGGPPPGGPGVNPNDPIAARAAIARGQAVFNTKQFNITRVAGLNDDLNQPNIRGTCGTCHDSLNVGNHSVSAPLNIGVADVNGQIDTRFLPVITLRRNSDGVTARTTDPGRAMITGKWSDIGRFKGPILRALAARAPYFHNGSAQSIEDVVNFYNRRFNIRLSQQERRDLAAFLNAL
ncbi:MAG: hypothetical protein HYZ37_08695 [Candidatus Solibacter usitatus]|nr:hypothetical protein [Candidatus Solibacter usitatus]